MKMVLKLVCRGLQAALSSALPQFANCQPTCLLNIGLPEPAAGLCRVAD
jgi:hypothetical protein